MDDNIRDFYRLNANKKIRVADGTIFRCMEDFCARYSNVMLGGPNYLFFAKQNQKLPPFVANTKLYSCILIRNSLNMRWRARYNEDVDLSIRVLKKGFCTIQFNAFLQGKMRTQNMKGGNTDELYAKGTEEKSAMIAKLHPDICRVTWRFGRVHHYTDWRPFRKNKLIRDPGLPVEEGVNEYGMRVVTTK